MAKSYVSCQQCKTTVSLKTSRNRRDADRYAKYLESNGFLCKECLEKHHEKENEKAGILNKQAGFPDLFGTEKQISWAESIRNNYWNVFHEKYNHLDDSVFFEIDRASWWIDGRHTRLEDLISMFEKSQLKEEDSPVIHGAKEEATIRPQKTVTNTVAEIRVISPIIHIYFPERRDDFRLCMHDLHYKWNTNNKCWERELTVRSGRIDDRAAEAVNAILLLGIAVCIMDDSIRERGIRGDFEHEKRQWIVWLRDQNELGIIWDKKNDLYSQARSIPGAKWRKPFVCVSPVHYESILDFAESYDFSLSDAARNALDEAKDARYRMIVCEPSRREKASKPLSKPIAVDASLIDN
jgi:hypothetical protein